MIDQLHQFQLYWDDFAHRFNIEKDRSCTIYEYLLNAYTEPHRHYHTVQHIIECLDHFQEIKANLNSPLLVELAIWFHDVVYDPLAKDNELQSAEKMKAFFSNFLPECAIDQIFKWILASQKHESSKDSDLSYFLDIDLAILGSNEKRFLEYEKQIGDEYIAVKKEVYILKRAKVLEHFYSMEMIYKTPFFQEKFETNAKLNLVSLL
ncbi:metal-dependent hydrolase [Acinetobacter sp. Ac_877]|uniref:HD domain-containing protein n=1 Tax=Acinetobacter portensis TaxID=1839785 RepID=UPI00128E7470|nr:metal-dependent hydrolase [Acinetobacter portensis]MPW42301.1 metal-dependent hydrolase [Acinetobacter portensis]